jgi:hypothetical protein
MKGLLNQKNTDLNHLLVPAVDHKEPQDDDCGPPEDPVFANYSKYLWKGHIENPRMIKNARSAGYTHGYKNIR